MEVGQPAHPVLVRLRERVVVEIEWIFIPCVDAEADGTGEIGVGGSLPTYCIRPDVPTNPSDSCAQMRCARLTSEVGQEINTISIGTGGEAPSPIPNELPTDLTVPATRASTSHFSSPMKAAGGCPPPATSY